SSARMARPPMSRSTRWATSIWWGSSLMALASRVISRSNPGTRAMRSASRRRSCHARSAGGPWSCSVNSFKDRSSTAQASSGSGCSTSASELHQGALVLQQPALAVQAAAEARQLAVNSYDAMTGDDDRDRVLPVGGADGPGGPDVAQATRQLAVAHRRAVRDGAERAPHAPLEQGAGGFQGKIERGARAGEVLRQLLASASEKSTGGSRTVVLTPLRFANRGDGAGEQDAGERGVRRGEQQRADGGGQMGEGGGHGLRGLYHGASIPSGFSRRQAGVAAARVAPRDTSCGRRARALRAARSVRCRAGCGRRDRSSDPAP